MTNEELVAKIKSGENEAENMLQLWLQNKKFITMLAKKYQGYAEVEDLEQEGYIALCQAVDGYRESEASFLTYASYWIRLGMRRYIENSGRNIRIPGYVCDRVRKYQKFLAEFSNQNGREPSDDEIRMYMEMDESELKQRKAECCIMQTLSLQEPSDTDEDSNGMVYQVVSDENTEQAFIEREDFEEMQELLWALVDQLDERQEVTLRYRYQENKTWKEISKLYGVSMEAIRQTHQKALGELEKTEANKPLREYYDEYLNASCYRHIGVGSFQRTWTSATERAAFMAYEDTLLRMKPNK